MKKLFVWLLLMVAFSMANSVIAQEGDKYTTSDKQIGRWNERTFYYSTPTKRIEKIYMYSPSKRNYTMTFSENGELNNINLSYWTKDKYDEPTMTGLMVMIKGNQASAPVWYKDTKLPAFLFDELLTEIGDLPAPVQSSLKSMATEIKRAIEHPSLLKKVEQSN